MNRAFIKLYAVHFFFTVSHVFGWALSSLYFVKIGYTFMDVALYFALSFITSVLIIITTKQFRSARSMPIGLIFKILLFFAAAYAFVKPMIFAVAIVQGIVMVAYGVAMNIRFFKFRGEGKNANHSGLFFILWPIFGALLPALAGLSAEKYGMAFVFFISMLLLVPALAISLQLKESDMIPSNFKTFVKNTKGLKTIVFLQGIWEGIDWIVVPLATMTFISNEFEFGAFYSYLGIFGIAAFFALGRMSDRMKKRAIFIYPITIAIAVFTILSGYSATLLEWGVYRGAVSFLVSLFSPFSMTLIVDLTKNMGDSMISRGFFLNFGRALGAVIVVVMLAMSVPIQYALVVSGAILLLHPLFLREKKKGYNVDI